MREKSFFFFFGGGALIPLGGGGGGGAGRVEAARRVNGSYHKVSTVAPFLLDCTSWLSTHPRSCDRRNPEAQARQRRTPFWCQRNTPIVMSTV